MPAAFREPNGLWTGLAARMRGMIVNTSLVSAAEAAKNSSAGDLSMFTMAKPQFGTTLTHAAALWQEMGADAFKAWWADAKTRHMKVVAGNGMTKSLVADGACRAGFTDTDDYVVARGGQAGGLRAGAAALRQNHRHPQRRGFAARAKHEREAKAFIDFLRPRPSCCWPTPPRAKSRSGRWTTRSCRPRCRRGPRRRKIRSICASCSTSATPAWNGFVRPGRANDRRGRGESSPRRGRGAAGDARVGAGGAVAARTRTGGLAMRGGAARRSATAAGRGRLRPSYARRGARAGARTVVRAAAGGAFHAARRAGADGGARTRRGGGGACVAIAFGWWGSLPQRMRGRGRGAARSLPAGLFAGICGIRHRVVPARGKLGGEPVRCAGGGLAADGKSAAGGGAAGFAGCGCGRTFCFARAGGAA